MVGSWFPESIPNALAFEGGADRFAIAMWHASMATTLKYYVEEDAEALASALWRIHMAPAN
jgi:hypothetical protein